ncbi:MAG: DUF2306 domain-containing protein [Acidobacteriota bacterium]|nr:DUF2306 domain-containing protein [Acidobacteriota bacterium]
MTTAVLSPRLHLQVLSSNALKSAATFWFVVAVIGQWLFFLYIAGFYGPPTLQGNLQAWTRNTFVHLSYLRGDTAGNLAFAAHMSLAGVIAFGGALQLIPWIRQRALRVHRWNGRVFVVTALGVSVSGLYMEWLRSGLLLKCVRGQATFLGGVPISLNAVLIIAFVVVAWRTAVTHDITAHRRWALRAYLVANGQWFFRVGAFAWMILMHGPVGMGKNFDGPFVFYYGFGCYLLPLLLLELYLRAKAGRSQTGRFMTAGVLTLATLVMGLGIFGVAAMMWLPTLAKS